MPGKTNERAFQTYVEEILLTRGGWKSGSKATAEQHQDRRTAPIMPAPAGLMSGRRMDSDWR